MYIPSYTFWINMIQLFHLLHPWAFPTSFAGALGSSWRGGVKRSDPPVIEEFAVENSPSIDDLCWFMLIHIALIIQNHCATRTIILIISHFDVNHIDDLCWFILFISMLILITILWMDKNPAPPWMVEATSYNIKYTYNGIKQQQVQDFATTVCLEGNSGSSAVQWIGN